MTFRKFPLVGFLMAAVFICGCQTSNVNVTSGVQVIDQAAVKSRPVELPGGYDVDDFGRLRMMIADGAIESNSSGLKKQHDYMNVRFQSEMAKHKRYEFNAVHGLNAASKMVNNMKDQGTLGTDEEDEGEEDDAKYGKNPDLYLGWGINIQEETKANGSYGQTFLWRCTVNATVKYNKNVKGKDGKIKHHKGDIAMTRDFDLPIIEKEQKLNSMGGVKSGFNYKSDAAVQGLMQEIIIAASERIAEDLGRQFPVGGRIVGALGTEIMKMDQGTNQGVEKDMQMVVFARYDGVDVPLANAVASPSQDNSQLEIWRFADSKHAKLILNEIGGNPKRWVKETGNELYAVRAVPPQDSKAGTRYE